MKITLKDGSVKEYEVGISIIEIAKDISEGLARAACAGEINGQVVDLRTPIEEDCELNILTANDKEGLRVVRHTASHVMAEAVKRLPPTRVIRISSTTAPPKAPSCPSPVPWHCPWWIRASG